jgi:hypothetical protein
MIACLDHGSIDLLSASPTGKILDDIVIKMKKNRVSNQILSDTVVHFKITAPLFVIIAMNRFKKIQDESYEPQVYKPKIDDVKALDISVSNEIAEHMLQTIEAGLANETLYAKDGCNGFTATMTKTVSTYWSGVISGDLRSWIDFANEPHAPHHIAVYQSAVKDLLIVEFKNLDDYARRAK